MIRFEQVCSERERERERKREKENDRVKGIGK